MKKLSTFAAAAAIAASAALPVAAETKTNDPFVSTQNGGFPPAIAIVGGIAVVVAIAGASSGTD